MSHHKYTTEAFVISSRNYGEADATFFLITPDLGSIWARAAGIRKEESKLRYSLEIYSRALVTVVRGREVWRVTSAESISLARHIECVARVFSLLDKLIHGEDKVSDVFYIIVDLFTNLDEFGGGHIAIESIELVTVLRILFALGYVGENDVTNDFLINKITTESIIDIQKYKVEILKIINTSLHSTHL